MAEGSATITYSIPQAFDEAARSMRRVLAEAGLKITGELDLSGRLRRRLLVDTPPCLVLFAGPSTSVIDGPAGHLGAAALAPLHIVISARGSQTEVHVLRITSPQDDAQDASAMTVLVRFRAQLAEAIEKIGMRAVLRG